MPLLDPQQPPPPPQEPNDSTSAATRIRTSKYGEMEAHELVRMLDTIEDERARGRFRESIYISVFVWLAIAWFVFYGPRVLWHAPRLVLPSEAMKQHELTMLVAPQLTPPTPRLKEIPRNQLPPKELLDKLRVERPPTTQPPHDQPTPQPTMAANNAPNMPNAPQPHVQPTPNNPTPQPSTHPSPALADAPSPQPGSHGLLPKPSTNPSSAMSEITRNPSRGGGGLPRGGIESPIRGGGSAGSGAEILSDTQGVDFSKYMARLVRDTKNAWGPLLPEEIYPPLSKSGHSVWILTILPDGTIGGWKLESSTHDDAINKSAWGSVVTQGKLQPLPSEFHGPNLVVRFYYTVNEQQ
ncbi:energy transducer TonB [Granulicella cerasi]|uniref:Energy transducer TonB n=1 Tax=Granulicella cerasi TaxID=741063 RepID=A0ABW1ZBZ8_9BACT|nr:energy transducer TonB [Granulicella cerasi]